MAAKRRRRRRKIWVTAAGQRAAKLLVYSERRQAYGVRLPRPENSHVNEAKV